MRNRDNQQGQVFAIFGIFLFAFLAVVAIAINIGRLYFVARETQTVADASAIGGAVAYIKSPTLSDAQQGAKDEAKLNYANNQGDPVKASQGNGFDLADADIFVGNWSNGTFTNGGTPPNAVRTTPTVQVLNIFPFAANILNPSAWSATSQVQRGATAAFVPLGQANPDLPIMLGQCVKCDPGVNGCSQTLNFEPTGGKDAAWWPPAGGSKGVSGITDYVPARCNSGGPADSIGPVSVGTPITVDPGRRGNAVCPSFVGCIGQTFVVPVVNQDCGTTFTPSEQALVTGFSVITITSVICPGGGAPDTITIQPHLVDCSNPNICTGGSKDGQNCATTTDCPGGECDVQVCQGSTAGGTCTDCGTGKIALVQ
jgi:hypothetical protein